MPRFYSRFLGPSLKSAFEELTGVTPAEQVEVLEELALLRDWAGQSVGQYAKLRDAQGLVQEKRETADPADIPALDRAAGQLAEQLGITGAVMNDCLQQVVKVAESAARIQAAAKDKVPLSTLQLFINQIVMCAYKAFDGNESKERLQEFERMIREDLRLPTTGEQGTTLTPDQDVAEMDDCVPADEEQ